MSGLRELLEREDVVDAAARAEFDADQRPEQMYTWDEALYFVRKAYRDRVRAGFAAALEFVAEPCPCGESRPSLAYDAHSRMDSRGCPPSAVLRSPAGGEAGGKQ